MQDSNRTTGTRTAVYSDAAGAFLVITGLQTAILLVQALSFHSDQAAGQARWAGYAALFVGAMLVVGTGLARCRRWAAVGGLIWCVASVAILGLHRTIEWAYHTGSRLDLPSLGADEAWAACFALPALLIAVFLLRAALPKPLPRAPLGVAARTMIVAGVALMATGVCLIGFAAHKSGKDLHLTDKAWVMVENDGYRVQMPPGAYTGAEPSFHNSWHLFEVRRVEVKDREAGMADLRAELDHFADQRHMSVVSAEEVPTQSLRYRVEHTTRGRIGILQSVAHGSDIYIIAARTKHEAGLPACERFIDSFELAP